jgi:hypothetical protein
MTTKIHQTGGSKDGLIENAVAVSAHLHTHPDYDRFYSQVGPKVNGFTGIYDIAIRLAEALTDYEGGRLDFWEDAYWSWEEIVEALVDATVETSLRSGFVPEARASLTSALQKLDERRSQITGR